MLAAAAFQVEMLRLHRQHARPLGCRISQDEFRNPHF